MSNTSATGGYLTPIADDLTDDGLDDLFAAAIVGVSGLAGDLVRPRWQPTAPRQPPADVNWCAVGVTDETPDATAYVEHDPNGGPQGFGQDNLARNVDLTVLVTFYGPNAKSLANLVRDGFAIPQNRDALQESYISFVNADTIRAVPEQLNGQWIKRYDLPLHFQRTINRSYAIQTIESADVEINNDTYQTFVKVNP
jgi:hypothetical protein